MNGDLGAFPGRGEPLVARLSSSRGSQNRSERILVTVRFLVTKGGRAATLGISGRG